MTCRGSTLGEISDNGAHATGFVFSKTLTVGKANGVPITGLGIPRLSAVLCPWGLPSESRACGQSLR